MKPSISDATRIVFTLFLLGRCLFLQAQYSSTPEFVRIIKCPTTHLDSIGSWHISTGYIRVAEGENELLVHRSGKMIDLCPGKYKVDSLTKTINTDDTKVIASSCTIRQSQCYHRASSSRHADHVEYDGRDMYDHDSPPYVFLPETPRPHDSYDDEIHYLPSTDTMVILTTQKNNYRVMMINYFNDVLLDTLQNDSIIKINMRPWKAEHRISVGFGIVNRPRWEPKGHYFYQLRSPAKFEILHNTYKKREEGSSEDFATLSEAYFYEYHKLQVEAHSSFRKLYDKDKANRFYGAAYYHFLKRNSIANEWSNKMDQAK